MERTNEPACLPPARPAADLLRSLKRVADLAPPGPGPMPPGRSWQSDDVQLSCSQCTILALKTWDSSYALAQLQCLARPGKSGKLRSSVKVEAQPRLG